MPMDSSVRFPNKFDWVLLSLVAGELRITYSLTIIWESECYCSRGVCRGKEVIVCGGLVRYSLSSNRLPQCQFGDGVVHDFNTFAKDRL